MKIFEIMAKDWAAHKSAYDLTIMIKNAKIGRLLAFISILYAPLIVILHILVTVE